jgi:nitroreductase
VRRRHTDSEIVRSSQTGHVLLAKPKLSTMSIQEPELDPEEEARSLEQSSESSLKLSGLFQTMIQTRRTNGRLIPLKVLPQLYEREENYWIDALDRAVKCGHQAPNHKRAEPFTFKRMIAPSHATDRLAEIAYHVDLRQKLSPSDDPDHPSAFQHAQRKRDKWSQIPAFLVTTVSEETLQTELDSFEEYEDLPYIPPQTERALEDYASTCAAVQNVLLSLHSEQIATKWVTGPLIRTPAFRDLVHAEPHDRVVALIMVGTGNGSSARRQRRNRRQLQGDMLLDFS